MLIHQLVAVDISNEPFRKGLRRIVDRVVRMNGKFIMKCNHMTIDRISAVELYEVMRSAVTTTVRIICIKFPTHFCSSSAVCS